MSLNGLRILVTGAGGIGGVNFVRALRLIEKQNDVKLFIAGTDYSPYYIHFPQLDEKFRTPKHSDPEFLKTLKEIIEKYGIEFLHPHPSVEARVVAENIEFFNKLGVKTYLPKPSSIMPDKLTISKSLKAHSVPVPKTIGLNSLEDIDTAFNELGSPLWIRAVSGAGGRLALKVGSPEEARMWVILNLKQKRASSVKDFIIQEYLPGRDVAFDSLWFKGRLITSYVRERIEYPFKHISLSGITGTPSVSRIIYSEEANKVGVSAVKAIDDEPHGFFSVDLKGDAEGKLKVTEVDGKWHTTAPLWGYSIAKITGDPRMNIVQLYLHAGILGETPEVPNYDLYPEGYYMIRQMDCGVIIKRGDDIWKVV